MGIYDREYYREESGGFSLKGNRTAIFDLIALTLGVFGIDVFIFDGRLSERLAVRADVYRHPLELWTLLTAGFAHSSRDILHVGFNMFGLWLFGRDVEGIYGRNEFIKIYLTAVLFASVAWVATQNLLLDNDAAVMLGASGALVAVMVIFVFHFPHRTFLLMGIVPMPAWLLVALYILYDLFGFQHQLQGQGGNVAYMAHLAGAAYGVLYERTHFTIGWAWPAGLASRLWPRRGLKLHDPSQQEESMQQRLDQLLEKIQRSGLDSLSRDEQQFMEQASRHFRRRRQ